MVSTATVSGELASIPAMVIRGGTSKGVYLLESDLPEDRTLWGPFLIALFGARDATQIDGVGGARPTTSKCCIIGPGTRGADVTYTFAQVGIGEPKVYWDFNCGNLTPGVGVFAILAGLVQPRPGFTRVTVYQANTKMLLGIEVPTDDTGTPVMDGDFAIAGVSGTAAPVLTDFAATTGASLGGSLLPSGRRTDALTVPGVGELTCSIVDLANMCVFYRADEAGLDGYEMHDRGAQVAMISSQVRVAAQALLGVDPSKTTPWPVCIAEPRTTVTLSGQTLDAAEFDFAVRFAGIQPMRDTLHEAFPGTASACTGVAAVVPGTVVSSICASTGRRDGDGIVAFAHPSGVMEVQAAVREEGGAVTAVRATVARTVRPVMRGEAFVRRSDVQALADSLAAAEPTRASVPVPA